MTPEEHAKNLIWEELGLPVEAANQSLVGEISKRFAKAQREAVEKTQDAMLKFIFSLGGASMVDISEVTKAIFEITPEKVLLTKE